MKRMTMIFALGCCLGWFADAIGKGATAPEVWWAAIQAGEVNQAKAELGKDATLLNAKDPRGDGALAVAAAQGHAPLVAYLLEQGADVNQTGRNGYTALHLARNVQVARALLDAGASVRATNSAGQTPLLLAASSMRPEIVGLLLQNGADPNAADRRHTTPLLQAVDADDLATVRLLVTHGADVNAAIFTGNTLLVQALAAGYKEIAQFLTSHGAKGVLPTPASGAWHAETPLPTAGRHHPFFLGERLFALHETDNRFTSPAALYEYRAADRTWVKRATPPNRWECASLTIDGRIYLFGGYAAVDTPAASVDVYEPESDRWTARAPMPTARGAAGAIEVDGRIFVIGGWGSGGRVQGPGPVEVYDPKRDVWTQQEPMPTGHAYPAIARLGGTLFMAGIFAGDLPPVLYAYDLASDHWTKRSASKVSSAPLDIFGIGGRIYLVSVERNTVAEYRPETDTWTRKSPMPVSRGDTSCLVVDGKIIIAGGWLNHSVTNSAAIYDPASDRWQELPALAACKWGVGLVWHGGRLWAMGGQLTGPGEREKRYDANVEVLDLPLAAPAAATGAPGAVAGHLPPTR